MTDRNDEHRDRDDEHRDRDDEHRDRPIADQATTAEIFRDDVDDDRAAADRARAQVRAYFEHRRRKLRSERDGSK